MCHSRNMRAGKRDLNARSGQCVRWSGPVLRHKSTPLPAPSSRSWRSFLHHNTRSELFCHSFCVHRSQSLVSSTSFFHHAARDAFNIWSPLKSSATNGEGSEESQHPITSILYHFPFSAGETLEPNMSISEIEFDSLPPTLQRKVSNDYMHLAVRWTKCCFVFFSPSAMAGRILRSDCGTAVISTDIDMFLEQSSAEPQKSCHGKLSWDRFSGCSDQWCS